jgi:hypothetical protein
LAGSSPAADLRRGPPAYLLHLNGIIGEQDVMDAKTLPLVKMPNRDGFVPDPPARCGEGLEMTEALGRSRGQRVTDVACEMLVGQARNCGERHRMQMPVASAWFRKVNLPKHIRALSWCSTRLLLRPPCRISTCYNLFPIRLY